MGTGKEPVNTFSSFFRSFSEVVVKIDYNAIISMPDKSKRSLAYIHKTVVLALLLCLRIHNHKSVILLIRTIL